MKKYNIKISNKLNSKFANNDKKGRIIYQEIYNIIEDGGGEVTLDFDDIELLNFAFLNNSIGKLYSLDDWTSLNFSLKIKNFSKDMCYLIKEVVINEREKY